MRRDKMAWIGILSLVGLLAPVSNSANAVTNTTENNLLIKTVQNTPADPKSAFLVSKQKMLKEYENAHNLTDQQLVKLLGVVGFKGKALRSACAVAKAESNGRPLAFNGNRKTGDSSYGIFQINMIGELGPDRRDKFDLGSNAELFNPVTNAEVALHMTKSGTDWSSWSSLNGTRYHQWYNKYPCKS